VPEISVIMPVYNSEEYLNESINSVLNQSFLDFELILIDDGSNDNSPEICNIYAEKDHRVIAVHQKNKGISSARNKGLEIAKGRYIAFIDNDDIYMPSLLKENFLLAEKYGADVVKFGSKCEIVTGNVVKCTYKKSSVKLKIIYRLNLKDNYCRLKRSSLINLIWDGLYNTKFLKRYSIKFDERMKCGLDDQIFNMNIYPKINCLVLNPKIYYSWIRRKNHSTSFRYNPQKIDERYIVCETELNLLKTLGIDNEYYWRDCVVGYILTSFQYIFSNTTFFEHKQKYCQLKAICNKKIYKKFITKQTVKYLLKNKRVSGIIFWLLATKRYNLTIILLSIYYGYID